MAEYIDREALLLQLKKVVTTGDDFGLGMRMATSHSIECIEESPAADVVKVVRCFDCQHSEPLERNCELNVSRYLHCNLWRGDLTKNVWHKYKKYYRDYSIVEHDEFCSCGAKMDGKENDHE